jgi:hypothetical protein
MTLNLSMAILMLLVFHRPQGRLHARPLKSDPQLVIQDLPALISRRYSAQAFSPAVQSGDTGFEMMARLYEYGSGMKYHRVTGLTR